MSQAIVWRYNSFWQGQIILGCFFHPVTVWHENPQPSIPIKTFAGSVNPVYSNSTSIPLQVEHQKDEQKQGENTVLCINSVWKK